MKNTNTPECDHQFVKTGREEEYHSPSYGPDYKDIVYVFVCGKCTEIKNKYVSRQNV